MFRCRRCKAQFSEYEADSRWAELGDSGKIAGDHVMLCPQCGNDFIEEIIGGQLMSVDLWAWREECDHKACVGDCDLCDYAIEDEDEEGEEECD